jgi:hypothetical protein
LKETVIDVLWLLLWYISVSMSFVDIMCWYAESSGAKRHSAKYICTSQQLCLVIILAALRGKADAADPSWTNKPYTRT